MPYKARDRNKWRATVMVDGRRIIKDFDTKKEARAWEEEMKTQAGLKTQTATAFSTLSNDYLDYIKDRYQPKTYSEKRLVIGSFFEYLDNDPPMDDIDETTILEYLSRIKSQISANAANVHRKNLHSLWAWGMKYRRLRFNPVFLVDSYPHDVQPGYTPPEADVLKVLTVAEPPEQILLETYIHTGARKSEVFRLTWQDVNFENSQIRLAPGKPEMVQ